MVTNLNRYINHLLYTKGSVPLRGIGTITMERIPAILTPHKKNILPPKSKFSFSETEANTDQLAKLLVESEGIGMDEALSIENNYCQEILNQLINYNIVKVSDIGFLEKSDSTITFTPSQQSLDQAYYGLPVLPLNPVSKASPIIPEAVVLTTNTQIKDDHYEWLTYLSSLLLGAIMILAYHNFIEPFPYVTDQSADVETAIDANVLAEERSSYDATEIVEDQSAMDSPLDESQDNVLPPEKEVLNPVLEKSEDSSEVVLAKPNAETDCVIIIGVFTRTINALELADRLKEDGYNPYIENINDTQRVGLSFKCADYDLKDMINRVRKKYNRKAWYLIPQISI